MGLLDLGGKRTWGRVGFLDGSVVYSWVLVGGMMGVDGFSFAASERGMSVARALGENGVLRLRILYYGRRGRVRCDDGGEEICGIKRQSRVIHGGEIVSVFQYGFYWGYTFK